MQNEPDVSEIKENVQIRSLRSSLTQYILVLKNS